MRNRKHKTLIKRQPKKTSEIQLIFRTEPEVPVRMGVHAGNVITEKGNTFGQGLLELNQIEKTAMLVTTVKYASG